MSKRKTNEEFEREVKEVGNNEYIALDKYSVAKTPIRMKHITCGTIYKVTPNNFLRGKRCPTCARVTFPEEFVQKFNLHNNNPYIVLESNFYDYNTPIVVYCVLHNYRSCLMPSSILRGNYLCKYCRGIIEHKKQAKQENQFREELNKKHGGSIEALGEYVNTHTKVTFKCNLCGTIFSTEPNAILRLSGCPRCSCSKGELIISKYLKEKGIEYVAQKTFNECVYKRKLPFDFYLPDYNLLIEFDGKQHYKPVSFFGGQEALKYQRIRDHIKDSFASHHGIKLIRITSINSIEAVLNKHLVENKAENP